MAGKKAITLKLTDAETKLLDELSAQKEMSKTAVLRQALRLYDMAQTRLARGEKLYFTANGSREKAELMLL